MRLLHDATRPQNNMGWYGYGFVVGGSGALHHYGHEGGAPGMNGMLEIYSDLRVVIVALSNVDPPAADRVADYYALPEYLPRVLTWGNVVRRSIFMSRDRTIMTFMLLYSAASLAHFMHNAV
jgi:hypothetical protein